MIDLAAGLALGSMIIAGIALYVTIRRWVDERRKQSHADIESEYKAPAERDSIIASGATAAVASLKLALTECQTELTSSRQERKTTKGVIAEQEKRIAFLEKEISRLMYDNK